MTGVTRSKQLLAGAGMSLVLLLAHAWWYRFLTDDAFISFRYARNLARGHGLVFNAGFERVEGYTNFLWVIVLAAFDRVGVAPERIANVLSLLCGVAIWWLVLRVSLRLERPVWLALTPVVLLAATRSFAVWCTSGLETKAFELLTFAGALRAVSEVESRRAGTRETWVLSSLLLALASLTRPDGVVVASGLFASRWVLERRGGGAHPPAVARGVGLFVAILAAHLVFRLAYYGDWLPNTYYAKVGGRTWWSMGLAYATTFAIEYGVVFWLPLLAAVASSALRPRAVPLPAEPVRAALFIGALVPFVVYVVAIGGDHFEYRPLDLVFPFAYFLLADGAAALRARGRAGQAVAGALLFLVLANAVLVPLLGHLGFPKEYRPGFPGATPRADGTRDLVPRDRFPWIFQVPILGAALDVYNDLICETSSHAVGLRQEEHGVGIPRLSEEGRIVANLVARGILPSDTHVALGAVGALPYYSGLRTLDRLGLTDRFIARGPSSAPGVRLMAHEKIAPVEYAVSRGVDLWAVDISDFIFSAGDPRMREYAAMGVDLGLPLLATSVGPDRFLLALAPGGPSWAQKRLPRLEDAGAYFERLAKEPEGPWWAWSNLGDILSVRGERARAIGAYENALRLNPDAGLPRHHLGAFLLDTGNAAGAIPHLRHAVNRNPASPRIRFDLGLALVQVGDLTEAIRLLREGADAAPADIGMSSVLARLLATCPDPTLRDGATAVRIGERLRRFTRGRDARVLDTLATAYAAVGRFTEARRAAEAAVTICRSRGEGPLADQIQARADMYAARKTWF